MFGTEAYELEPLEEQNEQNLFLSILYHDARGGNAIRMLLGEEDGRAPYIRHYANKDFNKLEYWSSEYNAYATVNTFKSYKRVSDDVYNLSGIFIDLDGHDYKSIESMDKAIEKTKNRLKKAYKDREITAPTMITYTGRGLGIFYILENSIANSPKAQKSIKYMEQVRAALTARYKHILSGKGYLEVDTTVKDAARVCRLPMTMNKKIGRWCRLIHVSYDDEGEIAYCDLNRLAKENHLFDEINEIKRKIASRKVVALEEYRLPFLSIRLQKLELLQELRKFVCTGYREYMIFIYYNAAKQIYGATEAIYATKKFNSKFIEPLSEQELEHAFTVTDNNKAPTGDYEGFYKLPDAWVLETLGITKEENAKCRFGASKRQIERQSKKEANQRKREERNKEIAEYIIANPGVKYPDIAVYFGISERLVSMICKQYDIRRHNKKAEEVAEVTEINVKSSVETEESVSVKNATSCKIVSQSPLGVPSSDIPGDILKRKQDGLLQAYADLYGQISQKRRRRKQIKGQMGFRFDSDGNVEYYFIS